jgi:hypothetical protein
LIEARFLDRPHLPHEEAGPLDQRHAARACGPALDPCFLPAGRIGDGRTGRAVVKNAVCGKIRAGQLPESKRLFWGRRLDKVRVFR